MFLNIMVSCKGKRENGLFGAQCNPPLFHQLGLIIVHNQGSDPSRDARLITVLTLDPVFQYYFIPTQSFPSCLGSTSAAPIGEGSFLSVTSQPRASQLSSPQLFFWSEKFPRRKVIYRSKCSVGESDSRCESGSGGKGIELHC